MDRVNELASQDLTWERQDLKLTQMQIFISLMTLVTHNRRSRAENVNFIFLSI